MKIRVSNILKLVAVLFFVIGLFFLWKGQPIKAANIAQTKLYESPSYLFLADNGEKTKAWVISVDNEKSQMNDIGVKFFTNQGDIIETKIYSTKRHYIVGDFVNILYNAKNPREARVTPDDESSLGWSNFGWFFVMGGMLYLIGYIKNKKSAGLE